MMRCKNCDIPLEARFCSHCGQRSIELERPFPELLGEVLRETFDLDGRAARTLRTLFRHPGVLTNEFLAGRRKLYTPPLRLYLISSVLFFVVAAWVAGQGMLLSDGQSLESDAPGQARLVGDSLPRLMFLLLPVFALFLKFAFREQFYFSHLIHALHLHSAAYVVLALMLPLEHAADQNVLAALVQLTLVTYLFCYFTISLHHVYHATLAVASAKALGILIVYMMLAGMSLEVTSQFTMPESAAVPFLSD